MSRLIAIEWDNREARVAVASEKRGSAVVEEVFAIPFEPTTGPKEIGRQLAAGLSAHRIRNGNALVAVGRNSIELKLFGLPPAPDDELPEMVRFQAPREFTNWGEGWPLDYVALLGAPDQPRTVLAATMSPDVVKQITETCQVAGIKPEHLVLRASAAASLLTRAKKVSGTEPQLLIDLLADELDLTVTIGGRVVFTRTARLPNDTLATADFAKPLVSEVRRTLAAAQNQLGGQKVERVWLCAGSDEQQELARNLTESLNLPTELFDPFAELPGANRLEMSRGSHRGRFAPVLGMLLDAGAGEPHAIDFLKPKRRTEKPSQRPRVLAYAAVAAGLLGIAGGGYWYHLRMLDKQIADLTNQNFEQKKIVDKYGEVLNRVAAIDEWRAEDVPWLDEMKRLAEKLPQSEDVMLKELRLSSQKGGGGRIEFDGLVKKQETVLKVENSLRDAQHQVQTGGTLPEKETKPYEWDFGAQVFVTAGENK
jgi:Tfp pilus assembly PilM family ATPase